MGFPSIFIEEQEQICSLLGNVELHLLYKASVHGYTASAFHQRCDHQGPTVIVAYSNTGNIFGGYTSEDYTQTQGYINDKNAFLFQLQGKTPVQFKIKTPNGSKARNDNYNTGPCFGNEVYFLHNNSAQVCCNPGNVYMFKTNGLFGHNNFHHRNQVYELNECAVFKVTNGKFHQLNNSVGQIASAFVLKEYSKCKHVLWHSMAMFLQSFYLLVRWAKTVADFSPSTKNRA